MLERGNEVNDDVKSLHFRTAKLKKQLRNGSHIALRGQILWFQKENCGDLWEIRALSWKALQEFKCLLISSV